MHAITISVIITIGVTFLNRLGEGAKSAEGTIRILMESDFSSYLTLFLTNIGGSAHYWGLRPTLGAGGLGPSNRYLKLRP